MEPCSLFPTTDTSFHRFAKFPSSSTFSSVYSLLVFRPTHAFFRYCAFFTQVAKQILAIEDGEVILHDGDYKSYVERNTALLEKMQERQIDGLTNIRSAPEVNWEEIAPVATKKRKNFGGSGVKSGKTKEMNAKRWA